MELDQNHLKNKTVQSFKIILTENMVPKREKIGFQLWSAILVFAIIRVYQAQNFGCACSKSKRA